MASLVKQHGWYYLQFYDADRDPKRKRVPLKTRTKQTAEALRRKLEDQYASGEYSPWYDTEDPTKDLTRIDNALKEFLASKSERAEETRIKYESYVGRFADSLPDDFPVRRLSATHIRRWLDQTDANDVTRRTYVRHLKVFIRYCLKRNLIDRDITKDVQLKRVPNTFPKYLRPEQVEEIVQTVRREARSVFWLCDVIWFAVYTAMRRGEIVNLKWASVDLDERRITVENTSDFQTKSGKDRRIPLVGKAFEVLQDLYAEKNPDPSDYVFTHSKGKIKGNYLGQAFRKYSRKAGYEISFHGLRHTACSWLAQNGASIEAIRQFAGHSSVMVTEKYMHLAPDVHADQITRAFEKD